MNNLAPEISMRPLWEELKLQSVGQPHDQCEDVPSPYEFGEGEFRVAEGCLKTFLRALRATPHLELEWLKQAHIVLLWKEKGGRSKGADTLGRLQKPTGLLRHFAAADYVIWLAADHCRSYAFTNWQMLALLYHELRHAAVDKNGGYGVRGHDFEGFADELRIFGAWDNSAGRIIRAAQAQLPFGGVRAPKAEATDADVVPGASAGFSSALLTLVRNSGSQNR